MLDARLGGFVVTVNVKAFTVVVTVTVDVIVEKVVVVEVHVTDVVVVVVDVAVAVVVVVDWAGGETGRPKSAPSIGPAPCSLGPQVMLMP